MYVTKKSAASSLPLQTSLLLACHYVASHPEYSRYGVWGRVLETPNIAHVMAWTTLFRAAAPALSLSLPRPLLETRQAVGLLTKLRFVDNCESAKRATKTDQPYCIKLPRDKKVAKFGEVITIAHRGKVHKALIVGSRKPGSKRLPCYDTHHIVMLNEKLEPVGTRIVAPIPSELRRKSGQWSKVIALATKFI